MSIEEHKALVRRLINEWWNTDAPDAAVADELIGSDFIDHGMPGQAPGPEGVKQGHAKNEAESAGVWADLRYTLDELIAEGDKVVALGRFSGIHQGDVETPFGIRPGTGKQVIVKTITVFRIADGKLAEQWGMATTWAFSGRSAPSLQPTRVATNPLPRLQPRAPTIIGGGFAAGGEGNAYITAPCQATCNLADSSGSSNPRAFSSRAK